MRLLLPRFIDQLSYSTVPSGPSLKRSLNVCLFGPHRSGKTVLCSTITKVLSKISPSTLYTPIEALDSTEMERQLKSTIYNSFAHVNSGDTNVTLIDTPGRLDLGRVKIRAFFWSQIGILVASNKQRNLLESIEQEIFLAKHFNLQDVIVFLSKSDLPSSQRLECFEETQVKVKAILREHGCQSDLVLSGNNLSLGSTEKLISSMMSFIDSYQPRERDRKSPFLMKIVLADLLGPNDASIFGYLEEGSIEIGQTVTVLGKGREFETQVSEIITRDANVARIEAGSGSLCKLMLRGNRCKWLSKGMVLTESQSYSASDNIECFVKPFPPYERLAQTLNAPNPILEVLTDQVNSKSFVRNIEIKESNNYRLNLKLSHPLVLTENYPFAVAADKEIIGLGKVDKISANMTADEKLQLFMR